MRGYLRNAITNIMPRTKAITCWSWKSSLRNSRVRPSLSKIEYSRKVKLKIKSISKIPMSIAAVLTTFSSFGDSVLVVSSFIFFSIASRFSPIINTSGRLTE